MMTEELPDKTLYPIPVSCGTNFSAHHKTEPMSLRFILFKKKDDVSGRDFLAKLHHASEFLGMGESLSLG
jgi:hypothetical protein